jgi:hypothetical protein
MNRILLLTLLFFTSVYNVVAQSQPEFDGYNLPLMIINTHGQTIERTPRVMVDMGLIDNGEDWILVESDYELPLLPGWGAKIIDFSGFESIADNPDLKFKIVFTGENTHNTNGNNRFDNISIQGTPFVSTDIKSTDAEPGVLIIPNPVGDYLIFNVTGKESVQGLLRIFHYNGSLAKELFVSGNHIRLQTDDLTPGMYLLSHSNPGVNIHKSFIKY